MTELCTVLILLYMNTGDFLEIPHNMHPMEARAIMRRANRCYDRFQREFPTVAFV